MRRILVTGADGYIGTVLSRHLQLSGYSVKGLDACFFHGSELYAPAAGPPTLRRDTRAVQACDLDGFDAVVHLAELSNDPLGDYLPALTRAVNVEATLRLARLARDAGVRRWVQFSSCSVYGFGGATPVDEDSDVNPLTAYASAKVESEAGLKALKSGAFEPVLLRNATVFGASPRIRLDLVANQFAAMALVRNRLDLASDGTPVRPLVHLLDVCEAVRLALAAPPELVSGSLFNVGGDAANYTVAEIASAVRDLVPCCAISLGGQGADRRSYRVSFRRIRERLGFSPQWDLRRGCIELLGVMRAARLDESALASPRFFRLARLRQKVEQGELDSNLFATGVFNDGRAIAAGD